MSTDKTAIPANMLPGPSRAAFEFLVDAGQRSVLFLDVMRRRGLQYSEHMAETAPNVLNYAVELIINGRNFERPVNYGLVRVVPPREAKMIRDAVRSWWSTLAPVMARGLAASKRTAKSAWR